MATIHCPECDEIVLTRYSKCPHCGCQIPMSKRYPDFYEKKSENHNFKNNVIEENNHISNKPVKESSMILDNQNTFSNTQQNSTGRNILYKSKEKSSFLSIKNIKIFCNSFSRIINKIFLPYAKVAFVIWTFLWITGSRSLIKDFPYILFGYIFFCGIGNLFYYNNKKKYNKYRIKILEKENKKLEKELLEINPEKYKNIFNNKNVHQIHKPNTIYYDSMDGHQFEYFCADIIKKNGFVNVEVTQGSGDHGIDILAEKDGITYAIQCKCYSSNIGNSAVQQAYTGRGFYHKDIAVVLTNRYFTAQAKEEAAALGVKLWDRDKLNNMIKEVNI